MNHGNACTCTLTPTHPPILSIISRGRFTKVIYFRLALLSFNWGTRPPATGAVKPSTSDQRIVARLSGILYSTRIYARTPQHLSFSCSASHPACRLEELGQAGERGRSWTSRRARHQPPPSALPSFHRRRRWEAGPAVAAGTQTLPTQGAVLNSPPGAGVAALALAVGGRSRRVWPASATRGQ
jgi:hypothetical protein